MLSLRDTITIVANVIADTAWLYPTLGLFTILVDTGGWPLSLGFVVILITLGVIIGRLVPKLVDDPSNHASFQALTGLPVIYLAIAAEEGFDLIWGPRLIGGEFSGNESIGLIAATAAAGLLWRRGVMTAVDYYPRLRLQRTFRTGILALAVTILTEQSLDIDLSATIMLVPFFAVCLAGMAFARIPSSSAWTGTTGLVVTVVISGGLVIGLIAAAFGGRGLELLAAGWSYIISGLGWLLTIVLVPVLEWISAFFAWLQGNQAPQNRTRPIELPTEFTWWERFEPDSVPPFVESVVQVVKYPLLLLSVYGLYRLLFWAYQAHAQRALAKAEPDRESIRGEADSTADLIKLAFGLLPDWMVPKQASAVLRYPKDKPGISEVYALYFDMLTAAGEKGYVAAPSATPRERQPDVERAIPGAPVARITDCFNAARYGSIATEMATIEQLRRELEDAVGLS